MPPLRSSADLRRLPIEPEMQPFPKLPSRTSGLVPRAQFEMDQRSAGTTRALTALGLFPRSLSLRPDRAVMWPGHEECALGLGLSAGGLPLADLVLAQLR